MKRVSTLFSLIAFLMLAGTVNAQTNLTYTVSIPSYSGCHYTVCAYLAYSTGSGTKFDPYVNAIVVPQCASIAIGGTYAFNYTIPAGATVTDMSFGVSGGDFRHNFGLSSEMVTGNCNNLSNPVTIWTALSAYDFQLEGQNILGTR
ncbi:MAG: hypothetical protein AAGN35_25590 [Bacteroidota bacterium]